MSERPWAVWRLSMSGYVWEPNRERYSTEERAEAAARRAYPGLRTMLGRPIGVGRVPFPSTVRRLTPGDDA